MIHKQKQSFGLFSQPFIAIKQLKKLKKCGVPGENYSKLQNNETKLRKANYWK